MDMSIDRKRRFTEVLTLAAINYPNFQLDNKERFTLFYKMLSDIDIEVLELAMLSHISSSPFPPTIADLRKRATDIIEANNSTIDAVNAWGEVNNALKKYGMYSEDKALKSMSPITADIVKRMGWKEICCSDKIGVERGQFIKLYNNYKERLLNEKQLPKFVLKQINYIQSNINDNLLTAPTSDNINNNLLIAPVTDNTEMIKDEDKEIKKEKNLTSIRNIINSLKNNKI